MPGSDVSIGNTCHETIGDLASRPVFLQIRVFPCFPFAECGIERSTVINRHKETASVRLTFRVTLRTVTLNSVHGNRAVLAQSFSCCREYPVFFHMLHRRNYFFWGTVPPFLPVINTTPVSGQVTSSGSLPRTSNRQHFAARDWFQRMVSSTESSALPPYSRPSSSCPGSPWSHSG